MNAHTPKKWRPSLSMIVIVVLAIVLSLPLASLLLFRFYDSQLVRETEAELISQGAALSASMKLFIRNNKTPTVLFGNEIDASLLPKINEHYTPITPTLDLATHEILDPRPSAKTPSQVTTKEYQAVGQYMLLMGIHTQKITLAGFRILDPFGNVIAGRAEIGQSLAHVREVKVALAGKYNSIIRQRISDKPVPPIASISRGTGIRVFVAMPVIINNHVAGVIYLSRTPSNILKQIYQQRWKVLAAGMFILLVTCAIAFIFVRAIKKPIENLQLRTEHIGLGERAALQPLEKHGSREIAILSQAMLSTSKKLFDRTDYINTFASHVSHELKSPLTSIHGAAELMRDSTNAMSEEDKNRFLDNILDDTDRLVLLLDKLRDLAKADNPVQHGSVTIKELVNELDKLFSKTEILLSGDSALRIAIVLENAAIIFANLIENAVNHGATKITLHAEAHDKLLKITTRDNGGGISDANRDKIFNLFFTTRRTENGTGMGLGIVQAMLKAHGGDIQLGKSDNRGTDFEITVPVISY